MAQVRGTLPQSYDNVDKAVVVIFRDKLKELAPIYTRIFEEKTSDRKFERVLTIQPFGDVPQKPEGNEFAFDLLRPAYSTDFTHVEFGLGFEVTPTAQEDDQLDIIQKYAELLMFSTRVVQEKNAAAVLNLGFTTQLTPDGVSLFNSAHILKGGGTAQNTLSTPSDLSITSLTQALVDWQNNMKLESGQIMAPAMSLNMTVPPALEFIGHRLINSAGLPGSADNDVNPVKARRTLNLIVNPYLTATDTVYLTAADKSTQGLRTYKRLAPTMSPPGTDIRTDNRIYKVRFRRSWGAYMWQNAYAFKSS
jgi:hypothetical protein